MSAVKTCRNERTKLAMSQLDAIIKTNIGLGDDCDPQMCEQFTQELVRLADLYSPNPRECWPTKDD